MSGPPSEIDKIVKSAVGQAMAEQIDKDLMVGKKNKLFDMFKAALLSGELKVGNINMDPGGVSVEFGPFNLY